MKTGMIIYVSGETQQEGSFDMETKVGNLAIDADMVTVVSRTAGHFNVPDAWRFLFVKGMQRIMCTIAECTPSGDLHLTNRMVRLQG